jgi:hypothetical protein
MWALLSTALYAMTRNVCRRNDKEIERGRFRALFTKAQQQKLRSQINDPPENFKLKEANEELKKLESIAKKNESAARNPLPPNFMSRLREAISHEQSKREESGDKSIGEISLHISMFQADTVICYRLVNGLSHLAVADNRDYHVYAGKDALVITDWKLSAEKKRHKSTQSQMELACGWMEPMKKAADALHKPVDMFVSKKAKHPLFEGSDATTRALIAIAIGCDVYPGGAHNIGPSKVATYVHKDDGNLQEFVAAKTKLDTTIVDTFVKALLYEPANTINLTMGKILEDTYLYIHGPPACSGFERGP